MMIHGELSAMASNWIAMLWRASWQGGVGLLLVWLLCRLWPRCPAAARVWLWRLAYAKLLFALCCGSCILLPVPSAFHPPLAKMPLSIVTVKHLASPAASGDAGARVAISPRRNEANAVSGQGIDVLARLCLCWFLAVLWGGMRLLYAMRVTARVRAACHPVRDAALLTLLAELGEQFHLTRLPQLLVGEVRSPLLLGIRRPAIVLPVSALTELSAGELRLILAHELAHLRRHDLAWGWLSALVGILFCYHPLLWLAQRECRLAQESACNAFAVQRTRVPEEEYAAMLLHAARNTGKAPMLLAAGIAESFYSLQRRIREIAWSRRQTRRQMTVLAVLLGTFILLVLLPWQLAAQGNGSDMAFSPATAASAAAWLDSHRWRRRGNHAR